MPILLWREGIVCQAIDLGIGQYDDRPASGAKHCFIKGIVFNCCACRGCSQQDTSKGNPGKRVPLNDMGTGAGGHRISSGVETNFRVTHDVAGESDRTNVGPGNGGERIRISTVANRRGVGNVCESVRINHQARQTCGCKGIQAVSDAASSALDSIDVVASHFNTTGVIDEETCYSQSVRRVP
jgi:hypothetical protein